MGIQIDDGEFTRLHNTILEKLALARLTASEYRCLFFLFRTTYGWQKKEDAISLSQWAKGTGIAADKRQNVLRTLQGLIDKRVIYTKSNGNNRTQTWGFNKNFDTWDASLFDSSVISPDNSLESVITPDNTSVITEDNTTVISPDNKTVISPDNHKRKKESLKKGKGESAPARIASPEPTSKTTLFKSPHVDPRHFAGGYIPAGTGTTPIEVYYERFCINHDAARLNAIKEDDLARLCPDLTKLRDVVTAYSRTTFQPGNLQLILDWYEHGVPDKHRVPGINGARGGPSSEAEKSAILTRAKTAAASKRTAEKFGGPINPQWELDIQAARSLGL